MYDFDVTRLRNILRGKNISVTDAAELSSISKATLYNYLNETTPITVEALVNLCNTCRFEIDEVIKLESKILEKPNVQGIITNQNNEKNNEVNSDVPNVQENIIEYQTEVKKYLLRTDALKSHQAIPLYNIEAAASVISVFDNFSADQIIDYIDIPNVPGCDGAVVVRGDSMYPILKSGDLVGYKVINDLKNNIFWGEIHLISLDLEGDTHILLKYIQKSKRKGYVTLVSHNTNHQDKEIKLSSIRSLALIKVSIRYNSMA